MGKEVTATQISYIEKEVGNISAKLDGFIASQEEKMLALGVTFVRKDVLDVTLNALNNLIKTMGDNYGCIREQVDEHQGFIPMIKDIKKERDSVKFQIVSFAGKFLFWIVAIILGISAVAKQ